MARIERRRLAPALRAPPNNAEGSFAGSVTASVHAGYFVSGYETALLGDKGVLGLVGSDGVFRARRSGGAVSAGSRIDYNNLFGAGADGGESASLAVNSWDGVERYTVTREVFGYPAGIVVGASRTEQLAAAQQLRRAYFTRAGVASVILVGLLGLLGRLTWQLQCERRNALEERITHAQHSEYIAFHDSLTGLPNRAFFTRLLTQNIEYATTIWRCCFSISTASRRSMIRWAMTWATSCCRKSAAGSANRCAAATRSPASAAMNLSCFCHR